VATGSLDMCRITLAILSLILLSGCGADLGATVSGTVFLDGQPIDHGMVVFYPVDRGAVSSAKVGGDGTFELRTASKDGIKPGDYVATVSYRRGDPEPTMTEAQLDALNIAPKRYREKATSDLRFAVKPGANTFEIKMTSDE